ncbi:MAG: 50S ribosomal protein L9 [Halanaerobiaceae bacterium]
MKVILREDVDKLGKAGEIVDVADGYGRNYLIPKRLADEASEGNIKHIKHQQKIRQKKRAEKKEEAEELAKEIEKEVFEIAVKAGENGRLFGSVNTMDIAEIVDEAGYDIDKRKIDLEDSIKSLGVHKVNVKIFRDVEATLTIKVVEA